MQTDSSAAVHDSSRPVVSVIIVSYNCAGFLATCLTSLRQVSIPHNVIVIDNASVDDTVEMVRHDFPEVILLTNAFNAGFAAACNRGLAQRRGEHALLLNPDAVVRPGAIEALIDFLERTPDAGVCGPRLLNPDGTLQASCHPFPSLRAQLWELLELWRVPSIRAGRPCGDHDKTQPTDWLTGACLLLRGEALDQIGPLDPAFWMYSEEVDWSFRAARAGWRTYLVVESEVEHISGGSTGSRRYDLLIVFYRSQFVFYRKHFGRDRQIGFALIVFLVMLVRAASQVPRSLVTPSRRELAMTYWGIMRLGLEGSPEGKGLDVP